MGWPKSLLDIIKCYYDKQKKQDGEKLTPDQKDELVKKLLEAYDNLPREEKTDVLVPARGDFLEDAAIQVAILIGEDIYSFVYRWPDNNGFAGDEIPSELLPGEEYDRIGGEWGRYLAPLIEGKPQPYLSRAIPYYIPEKNIQDNPAYHRYKIIKRYTDSKCKRGTIATAFWKNPLDGGGIQVCLEMSIARNRGIFDG